MTETELLEYRKTRIKLNNMTARETRPRCKHPRKKSCTACSNGRCIALNSADFGEKLCPFFRSISDISAQEYEEYKQMYRNVGNRGGNWREI